MTKTNTNQINIRHGRKQMLKKMAFGFLILGALWLIYYLLWGQFDIETDDAYVGGNLVQLMPQIPGTVISINTDDTHFVVEGQILIKLDEADMLIALQRARANLAVTIRKVRQLYENVQQAKADLLLRNANLQKSKHDLSRRQGLVGARAISVEEMQNYATALKTAQARYDSALHHYNSTAALVENSQLYNYPSVESAKSNFRNAFLNWKRTTVKTPVTGYIAKRQVQVGQQVNMGSAMLAVVPLHQTWVDANFKENQLERLRIGQDVDLKADANGFTYHGKVVGLSAGTGGAFALLPAQNATGNWIKIVQRLAVRISLDEKELAQHPLQIGLSMHVTVYTRWLKGNMLSRVIDLKPIYRTTIYNQQFVLADKEINKILIKNAPNIELKSLPSPLESAHD